MAEDLENSTGGETPGGEDAKLLAEAKARLKLSREAERDIRADALEDLEFRAGKQWPEAIVTQREQDSRPCLVINRIPQFIQQVTNDQRQNRPSIKVHPVDDQGDIETAKIMQGIIRHIEYNSAADTAYDTAFDGAVTGGFGYFRIITDYVNPMSFDQEILIKRIRNPFSVFFDPYSQEPDGSDANWAFVVEDISPEEHKVRYPESTLSTKDGFDAFGNTEPDWVTGDGCRIAEYFYKTTKEITLVSLTNGESIDKAELEARLSQHVKSGGDPAELQVVKERKAEIPVIKWCKLNGAEILEKTDWPGKFIPIIPVYGAELYIDGKRRLEGIVRNAKDSQRMYNYWKSAETEAIALAPRAPFIAAEGQMEGHEAQWATANTRNHSVLKYKPTTVNGNPVPPPQRNTFEPAVAAITNAAMFAADDLKATTGIFDAALGNKSNETSGVAIQRRNIQAQTSNFHFIDNLTRSLRHTGRILIDLMPKIYDTARAARIIGDDGEQRVVRVNEPFQDGGKDVLYALDAGQYDVTVDVGPSFASKRQEAAASMMEVTKAYPPIAQVAGDLIVKNMDWPGAQEIAERLKKTLPPGLADDPKDKGKDVPAHIQAQMQQMDQMIAQLTEQLHEAKGAIETKRVELESKERIAFAQIRSTEALEMAKIDAKDSLALLQAEVASVTNRLKLLNFDAPIEDASSESAPLPADGAPGASVGGMGATPTGGAAPGTPMEGQFQ